MVNVIVVIEVEAFAAGTESTTGTEQASWEVVVIT